ncbi:MAG: terminase small subunit [Gallintestinimicrobium sp.]
MTPEKAARWRLKRHGRLPRYKQKKRSKRRSKHIFEVAKGSPTDENGNAVTDKGGRPILIHQRPPTVTGLALALGFTSRQALLNYQAKPEFVDTITRAKSMVEAYTEERLFDRDGSNGAQFSLRNNFRGWNERQPSELDIEEQKARIRQINTNTDLLKAKAELNNPDEEVADDGFLEALKGSAAEDWNEG